MNTRWFPGTFNSLRAREVKYNSNILMAFTTELDLGVKARNSEAQRFYRRLIFLKEVKCFPS